jgi:hypothetical protein
VSLLEPHRNPQVASHWVPLPGTAASFVTAAGAPARGRLERWARAGVSDVVTLQRADELAPWLPEACEALGLGWHHLPLSGRRLERAGDRDSIARLPELLVLPGDRRIVIHCSAGMHRTGVCLYLLLRHAGLDPEAALARVEQARPVTAHELTRRTRSSGMLRETADATWLRWLQPR